MSEMSSGDLLQLLARCSKFPWTLTLTDDDKWVLMNAFKDLKRPVVDGFPKGMSTYDRRLIALAPLLAMEVLRLRRTD